MGQEGGRFESLNGGLHLPSPGAAWPLASVPPDAQTCDGRCRRHRHLPRRSALWGSSQGPTERAPAALKASPSGCRSWHRSAPRQSRPRTRPPHRHLRHRRQSQPDLAAAPGAAGAESASETCSRLPCMAMTSLGTTISSRASRHPL